MAVVGDRAWDREQGDRARRHDPTERALRRIASAQLRGEIPREDAETLQRIVSPPRPGWHAWTRPLWTRW